MHPLDAPTPISAGDSGRSSVVCDIESVSCCNDASFNLISTPCESGGTGACNVLDRYTCSGTLYTSSVVCPAEEGEPTTEVCNYTDDDCNGTEDDGFHIGESCETEEGLGEYDCLNETQNYCHILETYTPTNTFTNTFTSTFTETKTRPNTFTEISTETITYTPSQTFTETLQESFTPTETPTETSTATSTNTEIPTNTPTKIATKTSVITNTPTRIITTTPTPAIIDIVYPNVEVPISDAKQTGAKKVLINLPKSI